MSLLMGLKYHRRQQLRNERERVPRTNLRPFSLAPGFSRGCGDVKPPAASTAWPGAGKLLKQLADDARTDTGLKPGANESQQTSAWNAALALAIWSVVISNVISTVKALRLPSPTRTVNAPIFIHPFIRPTFPHQILFISSKLCFIRKSSKHFVRNVCGIVVFAN